MNAPDYDADRFREPVLPDPMSPPLRILVVEDEGLIALNLELILQRFGCEIVGLVSRVDDIIDAARAHRPDGAFLDVNLRGRKVFDVLPEMMGLGVPCVLSSGYDDPMLFPAAYRHLPRIAKPFDETALRRACAEFASLAGVGRSTASAGNTADGHARTFPLVRRFPRPAMATAGDETEGLSRALAGLL